MSSWCRQRAKLCERFDLLQTMHTLHSHDKSVFVWSQCQKITKSTLEWSWVTCGYCRYILKASKSNMTHVRQLLWQKSPECQLAYVASCGSGGMCDLCHNCWGTLKMLSDLRWNMVEPWNLIHQFGHDGTAWYSTPKRHHFTMFTVLFSIKQGARHSKINRINRILKAGSHWNSRSWCGHPKNPSLAPLRWSRRATWEIDAVTWKCPQGQWLIICWSFRDCRSKSIKIRSMNHQDSPSYQVPCRCRVQSERPSAAPCPSEMLRKFIQVWWIEIPKTLGTHR